MVVSWHQIPKLSLDVAMKKFWLPGFLHQLNGTWSQESGKQQQEWKRNTDEPLHWKKQRLAVVILIYINVFEWAKQ